MTKTHPKKQVNIKNSSVCGTYIELPEIPIEIDEKKICNRRNRSFVSVEKKFIEANFDSYTFHYFVLVVNTARGNPNGFCEFQKTTAENSGMSVSKIGECAALLEYCNIIKIERIYDKKNSLQIIMNKITLIEDTSKWNLNHPFRNAGNFSKFRKNGPSTQLKESTHLNKEMN